MFCIESFGLDISHYHPVSIINPTIKGHYDTTIDIDNKNLFIQVSVTKLVIIIITITRVMIYLHIYQTAKPP